MIDSSARATARSMSAVGSTPVGDLGVRLATPEDVPHLAGVLARAFADDPYVAALTPRSPDRDARMHAGWTGILRYASVDLAATYTTRERTGVAIWRPPGGPPRSTIDSVRLLLAMARFRGLRRMRWASDGVREIDARRRRHVPGPHFHLEALAVEVGRRDAGTGTALLRPILDRCDASSLPASLETVNRMSLPLYERLGFRVVDELTLPVAQLGCWIMVRDARVSGAVSAADGTGGGA